MGTTNTPSRFDLSAPPATKEEKAEKLRRLHESQPDKTGLGGLFDFWSDEFTDEEFEEALDDLKKMRHPVERSIREFEP